MIESETPEDPQLPASAEASSAASDEAAAAPRWLRTPPIDIFETEQGLVLRADLPGVTPETLELQVQDNRLTLFGRVDIKLPEVSQLAHQEYHVGDFLRSFILSDDVDHERISAKLTDGVLELTLPRAEKIKPRKIPVAT
ncbi:MAG: Hsp20/alpha crystallin family protein [Planctomycetaceae bacterium]